MENIVQNMSPDEQASLKLRRLYESRGFRRVRPGKFEEYALYVENKNFLRSEQIISFMDMDGKLLALKPDVTLSIIKNIPASPLPCFQKLYYIDEVYRASRENREYRAHTQIGVELVGPPDPFAGVEVVDLALLSLAAIGERYVLDVSHQGFVSKLVESIGLSHNVGRRVLAAIHAKSTHEVGALLEQEGVCERDKNRLLALASIHGDVLSALPKALELVDCDEMRAAYDELTALARALSGNGFADKLRLDFSVVNDLDYYNGLIFQGYVEGVPGSILTGGRYDNLMRKMGKQSGAAGFAVSLDELSAYIRTGRRYDFDMLVTYSANCDWAALLHEVKSLTAAGLSVRLERADAELAPPDFHCERHCRFEQDRLIEAEEETL